jgi:undecaprenyl-diphosphatase
VEAAVNGFDQALLLWLNGLAGDARVFDSLMRIIASDYLMPLVFSAALAALWFAAKSSSDRPGFQRAALVGISSVGLSNVAVWLLNISWHRPRPFELLPGDVNLLFYPPTDPSFPANAVAVGFAAGAAAWMVSRRLGIALCVAALLLGFSRVYAGVFWPTDIFGGAAVGVLVTWGTVWLGRVLEPFPAIATRLARAIGLG